MKTKFVNLLSTMALGVAVSLATASTAQAYSCNAIFKEANKLIKQAETKASNKTDSRIMSMIEEAKGLASAGLVSHKQANQRHSGKTGKYAHGDSVRKGRWAVALAKEALFLLDDKPR